MFEFNPDMIRDDEGEEGEDALAGYKRQDVSLRWKHRSTRVFRSLYIPNDTCRQWIFQCRSTHRSACCFPHCCLQGKLFLFQLDEDENENGEGYSGPIREINLEALEGQEMEVDNTVTAQKDQRVPATNGLPDDDGNVLCFFLTVCSST